MGARHENGPGVVLDRVRSSSRALPRSRSGFRWLSDAQRLCRERLLLAQLFGAPRDILH
jgi:hypothetical protein